MILCGSTLGYDWYAFADQDDFWMPEKLSWALETLEKIDAARENAVLYFPTRSWWMKPCRRWAGVCIKARLEQIFEL